MNEELKRLPIRALILISDPKLAEAATGLLRENHLPIHYQLRGQGTASSEMMDMFGLGNMGKTISVSMMPGPYAATMLAHFEKELRLEKPNTGIAFTTAITGISTPAMRLLDESIRKEWIESMEKDVKQAAAESEHRLIVAAVNQGYSEEVMDAARLAGARGGTVLHARQMVGEEVMRFMGITFQEEKEMVLILSKAEQKLPIMKAIGEKCGMHSEARGIVFSTPIDAIAGYDEEGRKDG